MILTIDNKDYNLTLTTRTVMELEKRLGTNPINILVRMEANHELPATVDMLTMFHHCLLKYHHGISFSDAIDLYDKYLAEGGSSTELIKIIIEVMIESGIIKTEDSPNL